MDIKVILGIIFGLVALVLGYVFMSGQGTETETPQNGDAEEQKTSSVGRSFADLLGIGQSQKCTYEYSDGANVSSGTMYIADGGESLRGEFNFTQSGAGPMQMYMVRVDGYSYMWGSAMPQGIKTKVTEENRGQLFDAADANTAAINNTEYACEPWSADASMFAIPTNVQFMDMGDMMKMMGAPKIGEATQVESEGNIDVKAMQCAACDQAGPAKEQCRQALGCK